MGEKCKLERFSPATSTKEKEEGQKIHRNNLQFKKEAPATNEGENSWGGDFRKSLMEENVPFV